MSSFTRKLYTITASPAFHRNFSVSSTIYKDYSCKLLVIGGGSGGCTMASKFSRHLGKDNVIILEPSEDHYYQPLWTLVGAGAKTLASTRRAACSVLPSAARWLRERACQLDPAKMAVTTAEGSVIHYEYLVVAAGINLDYEKVPGLMEALCNKYSGVSTIYSKDFCEKTWSDLRNFRGGEAVFTYPNSPIKCPGAPQKIAYLADSYFTKTNVRSKTNISYNTCQPVIFGVKKYADVLVKVAARKSIHVNYTTVLKEIRQDTREAVFYCTTDPTKETTCKYDLLHVTPPMRAPDFIRTNKDIADAAGFLDVNKYSLQHTKYPNVYGIGDCTNTPNSKTAAAVARQSLVVERNLLATMRACQLTHKYDGYGACPLVTSYNKCILAEFLYDGVPHETMPFNQVTARESTLAYYMKKDLFPFLYWNLMLKGYYHGPEWLRRIINPFAK